MKKIHVFILSMVLLSGTVSAQGILYVNLIAIGSNNGSDWNNAYTSLQSALTAATSGDQIWVAKGTYFPSVEVGGTGDRFKTFQMKADVGIYGSFSGVETALEQRSNFGPGQENETVLSGDIGTKGDISDNCYHVFYHPDGLGLGSTAILDGFTITGGNADLISANYFYKGGGMYNFTNNSPVINHCHFILNNAQDGSAIYNWYAYPVLNYCTFSYNSASWNGGAIYNYASMPPITNCIFHSNSALGNGGAICNYLYSSTQITNCLFYNNSAEYGGGVIYNYDRSSPVLINSTLVGNTAYYGGAIYNHSYWSIDNSPVLRNSIIWGNRAEAYGHQFYIPGGTKVTLYNSCYSNGLNDVTELGGGGLFANNCLTVDPLFADPMEKDYRLIGTSPCINYGNNTYNTVPTDLRGEDRIQGGTIDLGAYEWTTGLDPSVPVKTTITGLVVANGETHCSNASDSLIVAGGDSTVVLEEGSDNTFISGKSILFLPGFHARSGCSLIARITLDGTYCESGSGGSFQYTNADNSVLSNNGRNILNEDRGSALFKVYPNPNNGRFTIELNKALREPEISLYNASGSKVYHSKTISGNRIGVELPGLQKGIYFLKFFSGGKKETRKIIIQ